MSLNAIASPALREPGPLVTFVRSRTVANVDSIGFVVRRWTAPVGGPVPARRGSARTFSPLAAVLRERTTPELSYLQARFAGLVSYGLSADLLNEILPLGRALHATTVRRRVQATAQRLEDELSEEQPTFITGCQDETFSRAGVMTGGV